MATPRYVFAHIRTSYAWYAKYGRYLCCDDKFNQRLKMRLEIRETAFSCIPVFISSDNLRDDFLYNNQQPYLLFHLRSYNIMSISELNMSEFSFLMSYVSLQKYTVLTISCEAIRNYDRICFLVL